MEEVKIGVYVLAIYGLLDYPIYVADVLAHVLHFGFAGEYLEVTPFKSNQINHISILFLQKEKRKKPHYSKIYPKKISKNHSKSKIHSKMKQTLGQQSLHSNSLNPRSSSEK
jgi:hypothetical protein